MTIADPLFVKAELAYRLESLEGANRSSGHRRHAHRLPTLTVRLPHRHTRHARPA
jgi:hypothetical protein